MDYNIVLLEKFLTSHNIPTIKKHPKTFLGISEQPHYENVWSNIYAFYFRDYEEHGFKNLFIKSLIDIYNEETQNKFQLSSNLEANTEVPTNQNGRIDILLSNSEDAIIIENKVYHHLNNNLDDYWETINQKNKIGIILSLKKIPKNYIINQSFISITHLELMQRVMLNLYLYISEANDKYIIFLKDFYQNILNITKPMDENIIDFFYKNRSEIKLITDIKNNFVSYVVSEVENAGLNVNEELTLYKNRNDQFKHFLCPDFNNLMITVVFTDLFNENGGIHLIVEVQNELLNYKNELLTIEFNEFEKEILKQDFYIQKGNHAHFAVEYVKVSKDDIYNLRDLISDKINKSQILSIYRKVKDRFSELNITE